MSTHTGTTRDAHPGRRPGKNADNRRLSPNRRRDVVENDEYAAFARRILTAYGRRVATGDIEALAALAQLGVQIEEATRAAIIGLREHGYSWTEIGDRLGISRQAARQRWNEGPHWPALPHQNSIATCCTCGEYSHA